MSFLILRPQAKCQSSADAFAQAGLNAVACGLIDTQLDQQALNDLPAKVAALAAHSLVIVTSTVAAEQCVLLKSQWPATVAFFAVGQSSADILAKANLPATVPLEARSEGLLALPQLQDITNQSVVIIKGYGGRELLADTLRARGALVSEWELYQRVFIHSYLSTRQWQTEQIQCIIATSGEVISAAFKTFSADWLKTKLWIVVSERTADITARFGVQMKQISISQNASDQALIDSATRIVSAQ